MQNARAILVGGAVALALIGTISSAQAEQREASVSVVSGPTLHPGLGALERSGPPLSWLLGGDVLYGVTRNLDLGARFTYTSFGASSSTALGVHSTDAEAYDFSAKSLHPELGLRYKLLAGYHLAPYLEVTGGYLWSFYSQVNARYGRGATRVEDDSRGAFTAGLGVAVDYRLFNTMFVGLAVRGVHAFGAEYQRLSVPLYASFYW